MMMIEESFLTLGLFCWLFLRTAREGEERQDLLDYARANGLELSDARAARAVAAGRGDELRRRLEGRVGARRSAESPILNRHVRGLCHHRRIGGQRLQGLDADPQLSLAHAPAHALAHHRGDVRRRIGLHDRLQRVGHRRGLPPGERGLRPQVGPRTGVVSRLPAAALA